MTLLTHFRNKKYAVVACDQKYTYNNIAPVFKNKIRVLSNDEKIVGNYGRLIEAFENYSEATDYKFNEAIIKQQQIDVPWDFDNKGCGILLVDRDRSILQSRLFFLDDEIPVEIELRNRTIINYLDLTLQYELNDNFHEKIRNTINQFCEAPIYFNELYSCDEGRFGINLKIHEKLTNSFRDSFINHISPDFNIGLLNEDNIRDVIKSFYKEVYSWGFERRGIGGNVDLMILDIETGKIESEVINQPELEKETHCNGDNYFSFE